MLKWLPNVLSIIRLVLAISFPFVQQSLWLPIMVLAALTEWADGFAARRFGAETRLGQILDPVADKILFIAVLGTFLWAGLVAWWEILLLSLRDLAVLSGVFWVNYRQRPDFFHNFLPKKSGKWATAAQYLYFFAVLALPSFNAYLLIVAVLVSTWSAVDYILWFISTWQKLPARDLYK